jgi:S-adenosylmethionine:tRNA-ribosyltransferase-isomerase (queuine synthetase)
MRKPEKIPIEKYDYPLPDERIAKYPLADRDASKVLVYRPGNTGRKQVSQDQEILENMNFLKVPDFLEEKQTSRDPERLKKKLSSVDQEISGQEQHNHAPNHIEQKHFSQVPGLLEKSDRLYFNATRVVQARLIFRKETGARIEIFCLEPFLPADHQLAFSSTGPVEFVCLIGNSKKWKEGKLIKKLEEYKIPDEGDVKAAEETGRSGDGAGSDRRDLDKSGDRADLITEALGRSGDGTDKEAPGISEESGGKSSERNSIYREGNGKSTGELILTAEISGRQDDKFIVRFSWNNPGTSFGEILERSGSTPIPPYLNREADEQDAVTYQTVYARQDGSVAAPTAGLHFTDRVLDALDRKGIQRHELILHVGAGTFIPVKEKNAVNHRMHAELVTADRSLLESLLTGDRKIAVGTTTTRSLESIYWLGVKAISNIHFTFENLCLEQWDAYELEKEVGPKHEMQSLTNEEGAVPLENAVRTSMVKREDPVPLEKAVRALLKKMDAAGLDSFSFHTRLMITPGYRFRVIGGLFTNFHQPKSTLLLLIAAVAGDDWRKIYDFALQNEFRFLSYGDSSLLFVHQADQNLPDNPGSITNGIEVNNDQ